MKNWIIICILLITFSLIGGYLFLLENRTEDCCPLLEEEYVTVPFEVCLEDITGLYNATVRVIDSVETFDSSLNNSDVMFYIDQIIDLEFTEDHNINFIWKDYQITFDILLENSNSILLTFDNHLLWASGEMFFQEGQTMGTIVIRESTTAKYWKETKITFY